MKDLKWTLLDTLPSGYLAQVDDKPLAAFISLVEQAGKPKVVVTTAIARKMVGFIWAIARMVQPRPAIG